MKKPMIKQDPTRLLDSSRLDLLVIGVVLLCAAIPARAADFQSLASIRLQAEQFVMSWPYESPYPARFRAGNLDSRLRLKACAAPLEIDFANRDRVYGNTALVIRCPVNTTWKLHLPVSIEVFADVAVAANPLVKGQILDAAAIKMQKTNVARLKNGYFAETRALAGLEARRNLRSGTVLTPRNLQPRLLVKSGQQVTLVLDYRGLQVKSSGQALQSARMGQRVRVRNSQSQRIVEGVVSGEGLVKITI